MVVRGPPFDIDYVWRRQRLEYDSSLVHNEVTLDIDIEPPRDNGRLAFFMRAQAGGSLETHRGVGIYFKPPSRNGILTVSSNPGYETSYLNTGLFSRVLTRVWLGFVIESANADDFFDQQLVSQREMIFDRDISWTLPHYEMRVLSTTGFPLNTQIKVDDNHWYIIWVMCGGLVRTSTSSSFNIAFQHLSMQVRNINWSYAAI